MPKYRPIPPMTEEDEQRFWAKVDVIPGCCWEWSGSRNQRGYGDFRIARSVYRAHRISRHLLVGDMDPDLDADHQCLNTSCVNPDHILPCTHEQNIARGHSPMANNKRKTHCVNGHEYTPETLKVFTMNGRQARRCVICEQDSFARREQRRRLALLERGPLPPRRATHCKRGHEMTPDNTLLHGNGTIRRCLQCTRSYARERYLKSKATQ